MILVDASIWVAHLRTPDADLTDLLDRSAVLVHPFVIGELACGNLRNRAGVLGMLQELPASPSATEEEALALIEKNKLMGRGIGYVDVHLLASTLLADRARLWTADAPLAAAAARLFVSWEPNR